MASSSPALESTLGSFAQHLHHYLIVLPTPPGRAASNNINILYFAATNIRAGHCRDSFANRDARGRGAAGIGQRVRHPGHRRIERKGAERRLACTPRAATASLIEL